MCILMLGAVASQSRGGGLGFDRRQAGIYSYYDGIDIVGLVMVIYNTCCKVRCVTVVSQ